MNVRSGFIDSIGNTFEGWYVDDVQIGTASDDDWYSLNVTSTTVPLRLETSTPADGSGAFVNVFNPHIELYNPSNVLIASGTALSDGRNEFIQFTPSVTGTFPIQTPRANGRFDASEITARCPVIPARTA